MNDHDDIHSVDRDFWQDEPTRVLRRVPLRSTSAARSHHGITRQHIPVIHTPVRHSRGPLARVSISDPFVVRLALMILIGVVLTLVVFAADRGGAEILRTAPTGGAALVPAAQPATAPPAAAEAVAVWPAAVSAARTASIAKPAFVLPAHPTCTNPYTVVKGDYWIRIAKRAGVTTRQLLAANGATAKTKLYPGRAICLPDNANTPAAASPSPATQSAPATTAAPATTQPQRTYSADEVEAIIREVWPDELEDEAVRIARRESTLKPTAKNFCCYGLFQLYYSVHKSWLAGIGVTSASQLFDPHVNAVAALALYNRAGGWRPWAL